MSEWSTPDNSNFSIPKTPGFFNNDFPSTNETHLEIKLEDDSNEDQIIKTLKKKQKEISYNLTESQNTLSEIAIHEKNNNKSFSLEKDSIDLVESKYSLDQGNKFFY